ncbi:MULTISPECIES: hypothetical protein [Prauserella salsuginis group]|uniref:Chromosome segregation ATPase n=1 Tax=Prauserella salsuginis TaxID=387889 RepID=A0ABW6GBH7_9PSEU|nr:MULTISPECIES: hypothetical protein [Prauserella salsuginis group]MCR3723001.1 hypothetical protein [Prauserella flava]MCR3737322.1 hypothetical protein [Prauserella salsuginis]
MYELSRVRLHSVGPSGARYQDVVLDFSGVGDVVATLTQDALFGAGIHHAEGGPPRRPSPASVLFLENGGGKSVLIKLIFSVMLPGRRQVVGTTNTRVLEKFVGSKDVAHVVLEWQHVETGERLITGKVSEWRGHVASSDPANLVDSWYCFRPGADVGLESLPLTAEGKLLTMSGFHDRMTSLHGDVPELQLFWTRRHHEWTERLDQLGLDTELFRYQRAMNAGEGEAADAFAFNTDEAFVEFLLRAVITEDEPKDLADVVVTYADNLAQRGELMTERDFVAGALDALTPLIDEEKLAAAARKLADAARAELETLAGEVAGRNAAESERLETLTAHVQEVSDAERLAEGDHRRKQAVLTELRRQVAAMLREEAQAESERIDAELTEAKTLAEAWRETGTVLTHLGATRKAADIRELVGSREEKARPALEAKNAAATALARGLLGLAREAQQQADEADRQANQLQAEAEDAQRERDEATSAAANRRAEADGLTARLDEVRAEIAQATADGLVSHGADVAEAARTAAAEGEEATAELARREAELERVAEELGAAQTAAHEAQREAASARDRAQRAAEELTRAHRRTDALAAEPRLAELLGTDTVTLETDTPAVLERLAEARGEAEREQTTLRMEESRDERALGALGSGGLLPAPEELQAALEVLEQAGITAWSGWRYLSTLDASTRADAVQRAPQLVSGVLLNDPAQLGRAQEVLTEHRLLPGAAIAVGTTAALADRDLDEAPGVAFLVPPNPAMYDEDAADAEREAISRRQHDRQRRLADLEESIGRDAALTWKLSAWREDYPPGSIAVLAEQSQEAETARDAAERAAQEAEQAAGRLTEKRDALRERVPALRTEARRAEDAARTLDDLAGRTGRMAQWTEEAERAREAAALGDQRADDAAARAARLREQAAEHRRTADGHRRTATTARGELAEVPGGGSVSADDPVPAEPVDALRRAFTSASEAYSRVEVGGDLRAELEQAEAAESAARAALENLDEDVRARAAELLDTPDGSDSSARAAAQARVVRTVETLEAERTEVIGRLATRTAELEQLPSPSGPLDTVTRPRDVDHGRELIDEAGDEVSAAAREWEELQQRHAAAQASLDAAKQSASGFRLLAESLAAYVPAGEPARAFDGDVEEAQARATELTGRLTSAQQQVDEAAARVRAAADTLAQYATEKRFEQLDTPVRQQVVSVRRDSLPEHAQEWAEALRPRLRTLTDDLAQIDRHRSGIVTRLQSMVEGAIRTLRSAQRVSRLPDGLGDWSGQEFLRIRFTELDDADLATALGEVVDEAAVGKTADGRDVKRDGLSLLLRGVRAAVPKGFRVDMLKPDSVLRTERQRVSEIRDVFSGGQQLTAAIILYCTLAALRANNRGRMRNPHSGVLFLDNPIGRASAGYLLELQRAVASALGVQLVYTTGLFDAGALSEFPLIVRLRNDADLRAGRKYLSVDATMRKQLEELPEPDGTARLTSTRVYTKSAAG